MARLLQLLQGSSNNADLAMDCRDICIDYRTGDLGTLQCLPKSALGTNSYR